MPDPITGGPYSFGPPDHLAPPAAPPGQTPNIHVPSGGPPWWVGPATTLAAAGIGAYGQHSANAANMRMAREQIEFQREMSNTAHQREVADLRAAGLNPILSVSKGGPGASSPQGARSEITSSVSAGLSSALAARRLAVEVDAIRAQTEQTRAVTAQTRANTLTTDLGRWPGINLTEAQTEKVRAELGQLNELLPLMSAEIRARTENALASAKAAVAAGRLSDASAVIEELKRKGFENMSEAQQSWWFEKVVPYIDSILRVFRVLQ